MKDERVPSFQTLGAFRPRTAAVINGLLLSMAVFSVICYAFRYGSMHVLHMRMPEIQFDTLRSSSPSSQPTVQPNDGSVASAMSEKAAVPQRWDNEAQGPSSAASQSSFNEPPQAPGPIADENSVALSSVAASAKSYEGSESSSRLRRQRVIDAAAENLRQYYAYPDVGQKMAD
ncbi:MAG: hypothetical protein DMG81_20015 [Acidobacteria bacterium]|nr:MAG: hypothetical protein DMG81_20015 [Acidobacteriota bacterium]